MRARFLSLTGALFALCLALAMPGMAQEGHPLKGSWIGVWEGNKMHDEFVVVILDWNGREITGVINPGTDNMKITSASLNPEDWSVRLEANTKDSENRSVDYVLEGKIGELELPSRFIKGKCSCRVTTAKTGGRTWCLLAGTC